MPPKINDKAIEKSVQEALADATSNGLAEVGGLSKESGQPGQYVRDTLRWKMSTDVGVDLDEKAELGKPVGFKK